jgi:flagellar motility protein MotE (MotC chaperone)
LFKVNISQVRGEILIKKSVLFILSVGFLFAAPQDEGSFSKEKDEVITLKKELTQFYNQKEQEYNQQKKELETLLQTIEKEKKAIEQLHASNKELLQNIAGEVQSKTAEIYDKMKPKYAAAIFNQMMNEGKIDDVFDIILQLKERNVTTLFRFLQVEYAALLTQRLKDYGQTNEQKVE